MHLLMKTDESKSVLYAARAMVSIMVITGHPMNKYAVERWTTSANCLVGLYE